MKNWDVIVDWETPALTITSGKKEEDIVNLYFDKKRDLVKFINDALQAKKEVIERMAGD